MRPANAGSSAPADAAIRYDSSKGLTPASLTIIVNTLGDAADANVGDGICDTDAGTAGDQCTLRAALQETNFVSSADTINFSLPANSTITLNTQLPSFSGNTSIVGPGSALLTIQRSTAAGTPSFRFFTFVPINGNFNNSISGLTLVNGLAPTSGGFGSDQGGAIFNANSCVLTLTDVVIRGNNAPTGGGLYNSGTATLTNTIVSGNNATNGGGIYNSNAGFSLTLTLTNSVVDNNHATNGVAGGIFNGGGALAVVRSTISGNTCDAKGGGIYNGSGLGNQGTATLTNSTVSGNNATGILTSGIGGIYNEPGGSTLTLTNATVTGNTAAGIGSGVAGVYNGSGSTANLGNSIVAKNTSASMAQDLNGAFTSQGYNLIGESTGNGLTNAINGDQVGTAGSPIDPLLGPLADNGGPTKTHALMVGSPAIDAGNGSQTTDQRNQPRPIDDPNVTNAAGGNAKDIGAYEAHTYQVNSIADNTDGACTAPGTGNGCTLREAITAANTDTGAELITFAPALTAGGPATITLLTALPNVATDLVISGPGSNQLNVQRSLDGGTPEFRIFTINQGVTVEISGLTISNGKLVNPPGGGGGIQNSGTLNLHHSTVSGNSSGIYNVGTLTMGNALVSANTGTGISSGVFGGTTTATISNSLISNNSNGGIVNNASNGGSAILSINATTISGNTAPSLGGGVFNGAGSSTSRATLTIENSTISGNSALDSGGGLYNAAVFGNAVTTATVSNTTISGNTQGGGIFHMSNGSGSSSSLVLNDCTISNNYIGGASLSTGGIYSISEPGPTGHVLQLRNSIVAQNFSAPGGAASDITGPVNATSSFNLIGLGGSGGLTNGVNNNQVGVANPLISPLANNGGLTQTQALLSGSPAIDSGDNCVLNNSCSPALGAALTTDQRGAGFNRSSDGNGDGTARVDIGAYELQSFQVTNTADSGAGSLRQAILDANAKVDFNPIFFQSGLTGNVTLLSALPDLTTSMSINGPGPNVLTVQRSTASGTPTFRILTIQSGTVNISGLTISGGNFGGGGAGLFVSAPATVTVANCTISGNTDNNFGGGGIANLGALTLTNGTVSGNTGQGIRSTGTLTLTSTTVANNVGSGIFHVSAFPLSITNSTITGNSGGTSGGGIFGDNGGTVTVIGTTVSGNSANGGAGIFTASNLVMMNTTVSGNNGTSAQGGGIENLGTATLTNCTVTGNMSVAGGGGIFNAGGTITLSNSTVTANSASGGGGIDSVSGTAILRNTIIAGNGPNDLIGTYYSQDFNLIGNTSTASFTGITAHNITNVSALLDPLRNNGGPTMTHALLPGSPAINAGSNANLPVDTFDLDGDGNTAEPVPFDQRGFARITNTNVDIGAFESRGFTIAATGGTPQSATIMTAFSSPLAATVGSSFGETIAGGVVTFTAPGSGASGTFPGGMISATTAISGSGIATSPAFTANGIPGSYSVLAAGNGISSSASFALTNDKINQTITFGALADKTFGDPDFDVTATASSALAVTLTPSGNCTIVSGNKVHLGNMGSCTITASQGGDASYNAAPAVARTFNIQQADQTITFNSLLNKTFGDPDFTVSATASSNLSVNFGASGACTVSTGSVHITGAGSCTITASQPGNGNFKSAPAVKQTFNIADVISINDVSTTEGDSGTKTLNFTVLLAAASNQTVTVSYATANGSASAPADYVPISATTIAFNPGDTAKTIGVIINGDQSFEPDETFFVDLTIPTNATISDNQGLGTILNDDAQGGIISFSQANYAVDESAGSLVVTVNRTGDTSSAAGVDYGTSDGGASSMPCSSTGGLASARCDFTTAMGTLHFGAGETQKTFTVLVNGDSYNEGPESFSINLSNQTGGSVLSTPSTATVTIADDSSGLPPNASDAAQFFVKQQYHDFLNREPDASGLNFWTNQITSCGTDQACIELKRINVSAAFFLSIEFQDTGYLVERIYKAAYGDVNGTSTLGGTHPLPVPIVRFREFLPDTQEIGLRVIVGQGNWQQQLDNNKVGFTAEFVQRSRFITAFPSSMTAAQFVDKLNTNAGNPLSQAERDQLVNDLSSNTKSRAEVLRAVAEDADLNSAESNRAFVLMQFFGYLRRNPNDAPDTDYTGYDFWLTKLNQFNGNFVNADMVKAFINSSEYRQRFGP
jgi:CSLREA domain-containing protein